MDSIFFCLPVRPGKDIIEESEVLQMSTKNEILKCLREQSCYVSGEELSELLGGSRAAVWKQIQALRAAGYQIDSATNKGYRLTGMPDEYTPEAVCSGLQTKILGRHVSCLDTVDSTNEEAKRRAQAGAPSGSIFVAETQTGGKGRLGRSWTSPPKTGLWFSILLREGLFPSQVTTITLLAGLAVCTAIRELTGLDARIKWPNDVVIGTKKVCGILTEMAAEIDRIDYIVVGVGVNVNIPSFPEEIAVKATSLQIESGSSLRRVPLLQEILNQFESILLDYQSSGIEPLREQYKALCISLERNVIFTRSNVVHTGTAVDISAEGELIVECNGIHGQ